jgi:hypothetical protein
MSSDDRPLIAPFKDKLAYGSSKGLPFHKFNTDFSVYVRAVFLFHYTIWEDGVRPKPFAVTMDMLKEDVAINGLEETPENIKAARKAYPSIIAQNRVDNERQCRRLYGLFWNVLTDEGRTAIQSLPEYKVFNPISDPVGLRNAILATHQVSQGFSSRCKSQTASAAYDEYSHCRMKPDQSLLEYKIYFKSLVDNIAKADDLSAISATRQAIDFIRWLSDDYYYVKAEVANKEVRGDAPKSLEEAFQFAYNFVCNSSVISQAGHHEIQNHCGFGL